MLEYPLSFLRVDGASSKRGYRFLLMECGMNLSICFFFFLLDDSNIGDIPLFPEYSISLTIFIINIKNLIIFPP